jgi:uncharacterized protein YjiS (DUF1127 family)
MNTLPDDNRFTAFDEDAPRETFGGGKAPVFFPRYGPARNDPVSSDHARVDGVALTLRPPVTDNLAATPTAREFDHATHAYRSYSLAEIIGALAEATVELFRGARNRWRQRRQARSTRVALAALDDRLLRDIGLHRSEIDSLEANGTASRRLTRRAAAERE